MPEPTHQDRPALTRDERKQVLVLACAADRSALLQACAPRPRPPAAVVAQVLHLLDPLLGLIPGLPGRWLRKASFIAHLGRMVGLFRA